MTFSYLLEKLADLTNVPTAELEGHRDRLARMLILVDAELDSRELQAEEKAAAQRLAAGAEEAVKESNKPLQEIEWDRFNIPKERATEFLQTMAKSQQGLSVKECANLLEVPVKVAFLLLGNPAFLCLGSRYTLVSEYAEGPVKEDITLPKKP